MQANELELTCFIICKLEKLLSHEFWVCSMSRLLKSTHVTQRTGWKLNWMEAKEQQRHLLDNHFNLSYQPYLQLYKILHEISKNVIMRHSYGLYPFFPLYPIYPPFPRPHLWNNIGYVVFVVIQSILWR